MGTEALMVVASEVVVHEKRPSPEVLQCDAGPMDTVNKKLNPSRFAGMLILMVGTLAQAEDQRPTKIWDRKGSLGETPKRITDAYPLSDQQNQGDWVKFEPMSDEFEGKELDRSKWTIGTSWWKGRQPALFSDNNVTVSDGKLHLTMRKEKLPPEAEKLGYKDYTSATLHTKVRPVTATTR
jgi:hypothetical protein